MLARRYHPDHNPDDAGAEEQFKEIQEAYRILSDETLRADYDLGGYNFHSGNFNVRPVINHYFYAICNQLSVTCFEEITVIFTYSGDGRIFRKPLFTGFHVTGSPYVSSRMVIHEGSLVKETSLTYIICPLETGTLHIPPATIRIQNKLLQTASFEVYVQPAMCYFIPKQKANGRPLKFTVHYEFASGEEPFRISEKMKNHTILIPRSRAAFFFHSLATTMKWICIFYGMIMLNYYWEWNLITGSLAGSLAGGINCQLMYYLLNMKSKFYHAPLYPLVVDYLERGFYLGESTGLPFVRGNGFYYFTRALV
jgi:hypothetical protein